MSNLQFKSKNEKITEILLYIIAFIVLIFLVKWSIKQAQPQTIILDDGHQYIKYSDDIIHKEGCTHNSHNN